jgi:LmbE family N-acetylglucosaminyl deacetylase
MLDSLKTWAKSWLLGNWYPILLPHCRVSNDGLTTLDNDKPKHLTPELAAALDLCDGTRTLAQLSGSANVSRAILAGERTAGTLLLWPHPVPPAPPALHDETKTIILSPHLDDAALSLGAWMIARQSKPLLVLDVFSTVSWWRFDIGPKVLPRIQAARDAEEDLVMRLCGASIQRWSLAEAPLRGYPLKEIFVADKLPEAAQAHDFIRRRVREAAAAHPKAEWFVPLCIGNHVDHRIARDAALDGLRDAGVEAKRVTFHEDQPYAAQEPGPRDFSGFLTKIMPAARLVPVLGEPVVSYAMKLRLLRVYYSQLTAGQITAVGAYARKIDAWRPRERWWRFDPSLGQRSIPPAR